MKINHSIWTNKFICKKEDVQKLKRRIDELEVHLKMSQKLGKEREKQVDELNKKLNESINNVRIEFLQELRIFFISLFLKRGLQRIKNSEKVLN